MLGLGVITLSKTVQSPGKRMTWGLMNRWKILIARLAVLPANKVPAIYHDKLVIKGINGSIEPVVIPT
jgi:hypothetical protein